MQNNFINLCDLRKNFINLIPNILKYMFGYGLDGVFIKGLPAYLAALDMFQKASLKTIKGITINYYFSKYYLLISDQYINYI